MRFSNGLDLAYCTNVHRGNTWEETFRSLDKYVLAVREKVAPDERFAIGLRLGAEAAVKLSNPEQILRFQKWLESKDCYVFTINGFPYGNFHGQPVKEEVYRPDWATKERLSYTVLLFEILEQLLEPGEEGSVSTLPGSFKEFDTDEEAYSKIFENLLHCSDEIDRIKGQNLICIWVSNPSLWACSRPLLKPSHFSRNLNQKARAGIRYCATSG